MIEALNALKRPCEVIVHTDSQYVRTGISEWVAGWKARGWGGTLPKTNEQQADVPEGATILANRHGSAPGIWLEDARGWVAMLPGVPREMRGMCRSEERRVGKECRSRWSPYH